MANDNKLLNDVAGRLGLGEEPTLIKKAHEFTRILNSKGGINKLGDFAKCALCLDLAASLHGLGFDKETALLVSGLKKTAYQNNLNMLEKMLELDKPLSVAEVCVQCSCTVIKDLASDVLHLYGQYHALADVGHPQYVAAAVYTACKLKSVKVQKTQFITISHLKPMQWKELENTFMKFAEVVGLNVAKTKKKTKQNELHEFLEEHANAQEKELAENGKVVEEIHIEEYDAWKTRILAAAKEALLNV